ncbi:hypothetical protein EWB00_000991 [Schistosoma japonicum]|uniref:Uncharacterized protein n=1 Tax=Schistosoma japonicum TaxID=6182 RepID=A0A4Z2DHA0_SCHJA|nr:hypothetical protein KSF78_0000103 [Schistosoma japonicum]TNN15873.1 hypothetical protein EWB00_000991 [Schistosoma japonicum]
MRYLVKAGGMRIVKHAKEHEESVLSKSDLAKQAVEYNSSITGISSHDLLTKEELESHDRCIKLHQEKPLPTVAKPHNNDSTRRVIQQPLK